MHHQTTYFPSKAARHFRNTKVVNGKLRGVLVVTFSGDELSDIVNCDRCGAAVELDGDELLRHAHRAHGADDVAVLLISPIEWSPDGGHS